MFLTTEPQQNISQESCVLWDFLCTASHPLYIPIPDWRAKYLFCPKQKMIMGNKNKLPAIISTWKKVRKFSEGEIGVTLQ